MISFEVSLLKIKHDDMVFLFKMCEPTYETEYIKIFKQFPCRKNFLA